jgi:hypothetical protein
MIAAMPGAASACLDAGAVSDRLISLLPSRPVVTVLPRLKSGVRPPGTSWFAVLMLLAAILLVIKLVLVSY